jgi:hypothetical protein
LNGPAGGAETFLETVHPSSAEVANRRDELEKTSGLLLEAHFREKRLNIQPIILAMRQTTRH